MTRWQTGLGRCFCERLCLCSRLFDDVSAKDYFFVLGAIEFWQCCSERLCLCSRRDWASLRTVRWRHRRSLQTAPLSGSPSFKEMNINVNGEVDCLKTFPSRSLSVGEIIYYTYYISGLWVWAIRLLVWPLTEQPALIMPQMLWNEWNVYCWHLGKWSKYNYFNFHVCTFKNVLLSVCPMTSSNTC